MDGLFVNIVGAGGSIVAIIGGAAGILYKQGKNNGKAKRQYDWFEGRLNNIDSKIDKVAGISSNCDSRLSTIEGYLKGMEDFRKKNGG